MRPLLPITLGTHRPTRSRRPVSSKQVLPEDAKTPDAWVQRHPSLIRLTGKHPFNVEAPPAEIYDYGFISPVNLHIVRNHGAVPKLDWDTHRIEISGNVPNPYSIGMDELTQMPSDCFPCLVVCAGNRRKEQNMIKKSIGFNWGPAAVGNTYWKGVPLRIILNRAGIYKPGPGRRFVCLAGPEGELPKSYDGQDGGPGSYGTSIDMETALDPTCDVIVAPLLPESLLRPKSTRIARRITVSACMSEGCQSFMRRSGMRR